MACSSVARVKSIVDILVSSSVSVLSDSDWRNDLQRFHVPFPCLDAVQDVVTTSCHNCGSLLQLL